jgi:hypothetical protein
MSRRCRSGESVASAERPARFYVPPGFDPAALGLEPGDAEPARYLVHLVRWKFIQWRADEDGFVRLKWDYLEPAMTRPVLRRVLRAFQDHRVLERDRTCVWGKRCHGYRLTPEYRDPARPWRLHACADEDLNARIRRAYAKDAVAPLPVHHWLGSRLPLLEFDLDRALGIVAALPYEPDELTACYRCLTAAGYRALLSDQCRGFADGVERWSVCRFGRLHTPVTRLPRAVRCCLSVGGRSLVELDVANSQPLFLGLLAREYYRSRESRSRLLGRSFDRSANVYRYGAREGGSCPEAGVEEYIRVCEEARFYESLLADPDDPAGREAVKAAVFRDVLFGPNRSHRPRPLRDRFTCAYPAVARVLRELKRKDYARSSWLLQNAEATLVIGRICGRLMAEHPDLALFTIHDSFLVAPDDAGVVVSAVRDGFAGLGVSALVRQKECR